MNTARQMMMNTAPPTAPPTTAPMLIPCTSLPLVLETGGELGSCSVTVLQVSEATSPLDRPSICWICCVPDATEVAQVDDEREAAGTVEVIRSAVDV